MTKPPTAAKPDKREFHTRPISHYLRYEPPPPEPENPLLRYGDYHEEERDFNGRKATLKFFRIADNYPALKKKFTGMRYGKLLRLVDRGDKDAIAFYKDDHIYCRTEGDFIAVQIMLYADGLIENRKDFKFYFDMFYQKGQIFDRELWNNRLNNRYKERIRGLDHREYLYVMNHDIIPAAVYFGWVDLEYIYTEMAKQEWYHKSRFGGYVDTGRTPDKYKIKFTVGGDRPESLRRIIRRVAEMDLMDGVTTDSKESRYKLSLEEEPDEDEDFFVTAFDGRKMNSVKAAQNIIYRADWVDEARGKERNRKRNLVEVESYDQRKSLFPDSDWLDNITDEEQRLLLDDYLSPKERKQKERLTARLRKNTDPRNDIRWKGKRKKPPKTKKTIDGRKTRIVHRTPEERQAYWLKNHLERHPAAPLETCIYCHNIYAGNNLTHLREIPSGYTLYIPEKLQLPKRWNFG